MQNVKKEDNLIEQMFDIGAHYGYSKTRRHPSVSPFIFATKNKIDIINLEKTAELLEKAENFVKNLAKENKVVLFVGTKPEAKETIKNVAESLNMPYVNERWIGGTISNFSEIKKRINELENYKKDNKDGKLEKYTKKERLILTKKMEKLSKYYSGLTELKKAPDALFIIDPKAEKIAATEAVKTMVPVIALASSDTNIKNISNPIIANDSSMTSIEFFINRIKDAYKFGQMSVPVKS